MNNKRKRKKKGIKKKKPRFRLPAIIHVPAGKEPVPHRSMMWGEGFTDPQDSGSGSVPILTDVHTRRCG
jgi:hypothetical protein